MHISTTLLTFSGLASHLATAGYTLQDDYSTESFFSMFDFFTADDPTHGYVNYVDQGSATSAGLAGIKNGQAYMGVDTSSVASGRGRDSVRITSKKSYDVGSLIILDLDHMPGSICGTWPAFWTVGPGWPNNGEIDIIEGVNSQKTNHYALHTGSGCSISNTGLFSSKIATHNCDVNDASQPTNAGCSMVTGDTASYGDGFNAGQGGVYATEMTSEAISIWFFPRSGIPSDITSGNPEPSGWGMPHAHFGSPCKIGSFVKKQQIVFDTTFCGDWAGSVWSTDSQCSSKASTCQDFVQNNPSAFKESYWTINSLQVFSGSGKGGVQPAAVGSASQRPTISGGVPTDHSGAPGLPGQTGQPQPGFSAPPGGEPPAPAPSASQWLQPQGQPQPYDDESQPAAQGVPQQQTWGGDNGWGGDNNRGDWRDKVTVSGWDGGHFGQVAATDTAPAATGAGGVGGQFYNVNGAVAVPTAEASGGSGGPGGATKTGAVNKAAAPTGSSSNTNAVNNHNFAGSDTDADTEGAAGLPQPNASANANIDTTSDAATSDSPGIQPGSPDDDNPTPAPAPAPAPANAPEAQDKSIDPSASAPEPTTPPQRSKSCGSPWVRSSWNGRYVTVTAMDHEAFNKAKRALEDADTDDNNDSNIRRGLEDEEEVGLGLGYKKARWIVADSESNFAEDEDEDEDQGEIEILQKRHVHVHAGNHRHVKKRGWW